MVVGLTGGIGSGKSTVAQMFSTFNNVVIYNADAEAKKLMNTSDLIKTNLIKEFGSETYKDNLLNTKYLAGIVFNDKSKLATLNNIVHPVVYDHLKNFISKNKDKAYILYENAILFENNSNAFCDKIITVTAPISVRIERVIKRDQTTEEDVKNRIKNQWKDSKKILQSHYVINNTSLENTEEQVFNIHKKLTATL